MAELCYKNKAFLEAKEYAEKIHKKYPKEAKRILEKIAKENQKIKEGNK